MELLQNINRPFQLVKLVTNILKKEEQQILNGSVASLSVRPSVKLRFQEAGCKDTASEVNQRIGSLVEEKRYRRG